MTRRNKHTSRQPRATVAAIIRQDACYFVARMSDNRVRVGILGTYSVTSGLESFQEMGKRASAMTDQGFRIACINLINRSCECAACIAREN